MQRRNLISAMNACCTIAPVGSSETSGTDGVLAQPRRRLEFVGTKHTSETTSVKDPTNILMTDITARRTRRL